MDQNKIMVLSAIHGIGGDRKEVCEFFSRRMEAVRNETGIETLMVGSEGDLSKAVAEDRGHYYVEFPNSPLSRKFNAGLEALRKHSPTHVICLDSDDIVSTSLFNHYIELIEKENYDLIGITDLYFLGLNKDDVKFGQCGYWGIRRTMLGPARCYSHRILDNRKWNLWYDDRDRKMAAASMASVKRFINEGNECKTLKLNIAKEGHMLIDIKTSGNITSLSHFPLKSVSYHELFKQHLPNDEAIDLTEYCNVKINSTP